MKVKYDIEYVSKNPLAMDEKIGKDKFIHIARDKLRKELSDYPISQVENLFQNLTGRTYISTANIFCLSFMAGVLARKK